VRSGERVQVAWFVTRNALNAATGTTPSGRGAGPGQPVCGLGVVVRGEEPVVGVDGFVVVLVEAVVDAAVVEDVVVVLVGAAVFALLLHAAGTVASAARSGSAIRHAMSDILDSRLAPVNRRGASVDLVCLLFDGITALDIVGPYEVLQRLPEAEVKFVARSTGEIRTDNKFLALVADFSLDEIKSADVLVVPGGFATRALERDEELLAWIRTIDATTTWTTSVCTGSMLLAAAGLLEGKDATTHWASLERLREYGAVPTARRVVEQGKIVTAAGVSAGIDMALTLTARIAGDEFAQAVQLGIEYDPQPPFDAGSLAKAPAPVVELLRAVYASRGLSS
jgi:putative intracellular protease/amidase